MRVTVAYNLYMCNNDRKIANITSSIINKNKAKNMADSNMRKYNFAYAYVLDDLGNCIYSVEKIECQPM